VSRFGCGTGCRRCWSTTSWTPDRAVHLGAVRAGGPGRAVRAGAGRLGGAGVTGSCRRCPSRGSPPGLSRRPRPGLAPGRWRRCSRPGASPWSGRPGRRASSGRRWPARWPASAVTWRWSIPATTRLYPSVRAAAADGPVDLALALRAGAGLCRRGCRGGPGRGARRGGLRRRVRRVGRGRRAGTRPRLARVAARAGVRLLGPNTSGFLVPGRGADRAVRFLPGCGGRAGRAGGGGRGQRRGEPRVWRSCSPRPATESASPSGWATAPTSPPPTCSITSQATPATLGGSPCTSRSVAGRPGAGRLGCPPDPRPPRGRAGRRPARRRCLRRLAQPAPWPPRGGPPGRRWRRPARCWWTTSASWVDAVGALSLTRLRPAGRPPASACSPRRPARGCFCSTTCAAAMPQCPSWPPPPVPRWPNTLPAPDLPGQPRGHRPPRARFRRGLLAALASDPEVDLVAGYALHEPDALDLVEGGRPVPGHAAGHAAAARRRWGRQPR